MVSKAHKDLKEIPVIEVRMAQSDQWDLKDLKGNLEAKDQEEFQV